MTEEYKFIWEKCGSPEVEPICGFCENSVAEPAEITLAHVLNALQKINNVSFDIYADGVIFEINCNNLGETIIWNIKSALRKQSLETQQVIAKLLRRKE